MNKLILAICLFFPILAYSAEPQRMNFNEYNNKIKELASVCTLKGMPSFNGFCLSQKYGDKVKYSDQTQTSITVALQLTSFEQFYKKCDHSDFSNVDDLLNRALHIGEARKFVKEMKPQKEALETYSNYFDYCKTKDENNLAVSNKLKWFEHMINEYSNNPGIGQPQDLQSGVSSSSFPGYFVGTFEDIVPKKIGGTIPDTKLLVTCSQVGACFVKIGENGAGSFSTFSPVKDLRYAANALSYAKEHNNVAAISALSWQARNLKPLLSSPSVIEACVDLRNKSLPQGYLLLCKLDHDPWAKNTVLLMGMQMSNCGELFCGYEIFPLFRK